MTLNAFVIVCLGWTIAALVVQAVGATRGRPRDRARRSGSPWRGAIYRFTVAMTPAHKETVRRHPLEFAVGVTFHAGALLALVLVVLSVLRPPGGVATLAEDLRPLFALSLLAGVALLVRRLRSADLRVVSAPDDYAAILASCFLLFLALTTAETALGRTAFRIYAGLFLLYFPLGKLRHAVFFFLARGEYGLRLGFRNVIPPPRAEAE